MTGVQTCALPISQIFAALYIAGTQTQADQTYASYLKAAAILEVEFKNYPDRPGVAHDLVHSDDAPPIAAQGIVASRRYATIAPDAPTPCTCPRASLRASAPGRNPSPRTHTREAWSRSGNEPDQDSHASDCMVYADLQLARDADARRAIDEAMKVTGARTRFVATYASRRYRRATPSSAARGRTLRSSGSTYPSVESIMCFAHSVGATRSGDLAAARKDVRPVSFRESARSPFVFVPQAAAVMD